MLPLIIITGPTAAGKTAVSIRIAQALSNSTNKAEIISADSRNSYRGFNIGSGKITPSEQQGIPHHCLDIADPLERFTAHDFKIASLKALAKIDGHNNIPIICGGTGFYIDTLIGKMVLPNIPPTPQDFFQKYEKATAEQLFAELNTKDPERAQTIDRHNTRRLIRALYMYEYLQKNSPLENLSSDSSDQAQNSTDLSKQRRIIWIGICPSPTELKQRIHDRLHDRYKNGLLAETVDLIDSGKLTLERCKELGLEYAYMAKIISESAQGTPREQEILAELEIKIWQYAKRQLTWHKKNTDIVWFHPDNIDSILKHIISA